MDEKIYWLGFSAFPGIGPGRFTKLLEFFADAKTAWKADSQELKKTGIGEALVNKFINFRKDFSLQKYFEKLQSKNIKFLTLQDQEYPQLLAQIKNPPFVLYVKGKLDFSKLEEYKTIAVVGTRNITAYGKQVTSFIVQELASANCIIVSGLAIGVDSYAHSVTLDHDGKTIAVLGSGVDYCTPRANISLYNKILATGGAIVSEVPPGQEPTKGSFPSRNRIIAGLSTAVVVTEGAEDSGSLITAENSFLNKRKVFAIPGPITSVYSKGPNSLLAKGAIPVTAARDILQALAIPSAPRTKKIQSDTPEEQAIIDLLQNGQIHIDELIKRMSAPPSQIGTILSMMEMKGYIRNCGSGIFALTDIS